VMLYEALRQRRRNVPPSDTQTPRPERSAVTPPEEGMDYISDGDGGDAETDAESVEDLEREDGEMVISAGSDSADDVNDDADAASEADLGEDLAVPGSGAVAGAPKKRAPRAKKAAAPKKPGRKKATD
jgi:hypothetical protein